jgi:hypothetical protein
VLKPVTQFPVKLIQPSKGVLCGIAGAASIEISLLPFAFNGVLIQTSIGLNNIAIPSVDVIVLAGQSFNFPVNPAVGYIDGSIYLDGAHHPVDVTRLSFFNASVKLAGLFVFEFEGLSEYGNTSFELSVPI